MIALFLGAAFAAPPVASVDNPGGRQLLRSFASSGAERSRAVAQAVLDGHVASTTTALRPVRFRSTDDRQQMHEVTIWVTADYLALGTEADAVYAPLDLPGARRVARGLGAILPTSSLCDAIHAADADPLTPQPIPPHPNMVTTATLLQHQQMVADDVARDRDGLVSGHKKDLVLTARLGDEPDRVAIYGWHRTDGTPIQPVSLWHGEQYVDYSHGVRLVARTIEVDGVAMDILDVLADPHLATLVSDEGPLEPHLLDDWR